MIESLSSKARLPSLINVDAGPHVRPPSAERLTTMAPNAFGWNEAPPKTMALWYAAPSGAIVTHGSLIRG